MKNNVEIIINTTNKFPVALAEIEKDLSESIINVGEITNKKFANIIRQKLLKKYMENKKKTIY